MSWSISERFLSPPEKPTLMSLFRKLASLNVSMSFCSSGLKFSSGFFPKHSFSRSASFTPEISGGFWKLPTIPSLALSSVLFAVMSCPMKNIFPETTSYAGSPSKVLISVVLPEPFGPKSMWLSPCLRLKFKFFRTGLP